MQVRAGFGAFLLFLFMHQPRGREDKLHDTVNSVFHICLE
jgi:hypothetical protein